MKIAVFGLGYVGVVTAGCFASEGHQVIGVDVSEQKVMNLGQGISPIIEDRIGEMISEVVEKGLLTATMDATAAVESCDMGIVCVGTPSAESGELELKYVENVTRTIGACLKRRKKPFLLVIRSTVVPGTTRQRLLPILEEEMGCSCGNGVDIVFHPEFLREGSSVVDFYAPPKIVVGEMRNGASAMLWELYPEETFSTKRFNCSLETAETVKYCDNMFHALKVCFANEVGRFCSEMDFDSREVMSIFVEDRKLNISPKYLRPGFAFGGSCLPKDLRAFLAIANRAGVKLPMLSNVLDSNEVHIKRVCALLQRENLKSAGFYGLSFKQGTDDLRESPNVALAEFLIGKGVAVSIFDEYVVESRLVGQNKSFVEMHLPHLANLLVEDVAALESTDILLLAHTPPEEFLEKWLKAGVRVGDLTGMVKNPGYGQFVSLV